MNSSMKMILPFVFMIFCLLSSLHASLLVALDFCVANYTAPNGPSGYSCRNPLNVTANDFVYSGLAHPGNTNILFKASVALAFVDQFPALNGLGISMNRVDLAKGGVIPMHTHPRGNEAFYVVQGTITAGFISTNYTVYIKTLHKGDLMVFPNGLLHFQINQGDGPATGIASYSSANPGIQVVPFSLFSNNLSTNVISQTTFINAAEVMRLKRIFGGSG